MKLSTRLTVAMGALVLLALAVFALIASRDVRTVVLPRALEHLELDTRLLAADIDALIRGARADVASYRRAPGPTAMLRARRNGGIDPVDGATETVWRGLVAGRLTEEIAAKPAYRQFRYIAIEDGGREVVRVERLPDGSIRIAGDDELQRKGDMLYFKEAVALPAGTIYVSPVELNRERGEIERPYAPVMRVATPLKYADGKPFGIVIINLDMRAAFERIRTAAKADARIYAVNERGEFLVHPDRSREFAFEFNSPDRLDSDFPSLGGTFGTAAVKSRLVTNAEGEDFGVAVIPVNLMDRRRIDLIQTLPYAAIMAPANAVLHAGGYAALTAIVIAIILGALLSRSLTRSLVQVTNAVEALGRDEWLPVPENAAGEIGVLARAFARMADDNRNKTSAIKKEIAERRRLFETSRDLILITDRRGMFLQVNPSCEAILGYHPDEMTGRSAIEFIHADDLDSTRKQMRLVRRGEVSGFEARYIHRDGHVVTLAWTGVWSEPERRYFFFGRDMTKERMSEQAVKQALSRQQAVFNSAMIGIVTLNESGSIETLNPAAERIFGVTLDAVERRDIGRLIDLGGPSDISSASRLRHLADDDGAVRELVGRRSDNTTFPVDFELTDMPIGDRRMFVVFVRDIAVRKLHERMKDEFVATVSHELRTPLTSISGSLGLLVGGAVGQLSDSAKRLLTIAHTNSQRLVRLINDILDIEKIESSKIVFALQPVELRALAEQSIDANKGFAESFGVSVRLDPGSAEAMIRVDPDRMTQVIINLLSNAVKFSPRGEEVLVKVENLDTTVRLSVIDRGPGIPDEYKQRIFEKFVQVDATDARQKGGTGLGLSIVRQIVLRLGGEIGVEAAPGGGSVFHVDLPCWDHIELLETERLGRAGSALILLCEDDPDAAALLATRLRAAGFPTDVAHTAEDAIKGAATCAYAAILVDLQLPDSDGITLIKNLRAQPQYHNTPIVVVSADPKRGRDDQRSSTLNILDWLEKPVDTGRLLHVLNRPIVRDSFVRPRILHVDDDRDVLRLVAQTLGSTAEVVSAETIDEARHLLDVQTFDLAVLDVALAEGFGLDLLPDLCGSDGQPIPVIVFSAQDSPEVAARVLAVLSKSRASFDSLVSTLRRLVAGRVSRLNTDLEVA